MNRKSSYIGQLSSGYESSTVKEYDPATEQGQIGKAETEAVTTEPIWKNDQRIPGLGIGVLSMQEAAIKLRKIARALATMEMDYKTDKKASSAINVATYTQMTQNGDLLRVATRIQEIGADLAKLVKTAQMNHPEEKPSTPPWLEESSSQTGDEQWIDIGQAKFDDQRDPTGRAA